jgi:hypothetical protein
MCLFLLERTDTVLSEMSSTRCLCALDSHSLFLAILGRDVGRVSNWLCGRALHVRDAYDSKSNKERKLVQTNSTLFLLWFVAVETTFERDVLWNGRDNDGWPDCQVVEETE